MELIDLRARREEDELRRLTNDLSRHGHQSEPTTPPEYRADNRFPTSLSRPNRYSSASLVSPPGIINNRPSRSGSQVLSSQIDIAKAFNALNNSTLPSKSTPGSRRNSEEDEDHFDYDYPGTSHRSAAL